MSDDLDAVMDALQDAGHTTQVSDKKLNRIIRKVTGTTRKGQWEHVKQSLVALDWITPKSENKGSVHVWWCDPDGRAATELAAEQEIDTHTLAHPGGDADEYDAEEDGGS